VYFNYISECIKISLPVTIEVYKHLLDNLCNHAYRIIYGNDRKGISMNGNILVQVTQKVE